MKTSYREYLYLSRNSCFFAEFENTSIFNRIHNLLPYRKVEVVFILRTLEWILVILNVICGFIQILLYLNQLPIWMSSIDIVLIITFFVMGYFTILESRLKKFDGHLIFAGILFLGNLAFFIIIGFNPFLSSSTIGDVRGLEVVTYFDFGTLGNFIARIRGIS